jgi:enoyl-CoA hydratase/carnithine racemase
MENNANTDLKVERQNSTLTLTLNRPNSSNALSPALVEALLTEISNAQDVRLCVIKGEGRNFCAGFDLSDIDLLSDGDLLWRFLRIETLLQAIYHAPFPVIAFAQGYAIGAGFDLFAACWQRVATSNVKFRMPGWQFELALGTRRLTRLVGTDNARDLLIDTKTMLAEQALEIGMATEIAEPEEWGGILKIAKQRSEALPQNALKQMLSLTIADTRAEDMASIVATAGVPGLKQRILDYKERLKRR